MKRNEAFRLCKRFNGEGAVDGKPHLQPFLSFAVSDTGYRDLLKLIQQLRIGDDMSKNIGKSVGPVHDLF